jgi:hypothetical protein
MPNNGPDLHWRIEQKTMFSIPQGMTIDSIAEGDRPLLTPVNFYKCDISRKLEVAYPAGNIDLSRNLVPGDSKLASALFPFLIIAQETSSYWGFRHNDYFTMLNLYARTYGDEAVKAAMEKIIPRMRFAAALNEFLDMSPPLLAKVNYAPTPGEIAVPVYFVTDSLLRNATGAITIPNRVPRAVAIVPPAPPKAAGDSQAKPANP